MDWSCRTAAWRQQVVDHRLAVAGLLDKSRLKASQQSILGENNYELHEGCSSNTGRHIKFAVNNKGTGRLGIPSAIAELSKTETAPATENPTRLSTTGNSVRALRNLGAKRKVKTKI